MTTAPTWVSKRVARLHASTVLGRRERVLADAILQILPSGTRSVLDVGCGDGVVASLVAEARPGLRVEGLEVHERPTCRVPYSLYDGSKLPFADNSFDVVEVVDMLHHTDGIDDLLRECSRVAALGVIIKDHIWSRRVDFQVLKFMDWVGNHGHGVNLPYNYQQKSQWFELFEKAQVKTAVWDESEIGLYPFPFNLVFERGRHFLALVSAIGPEGRAVEN